MVHEAVKVELYGANRDGDARRYEVASGTAITKGTVLQLTDARTGSAHSAAKQPCAGIASMDKAGNDYSTSITAWTNGIFEMYASGAINAGNPVQLGDTPNYVFLPAEADTTVSGAAIIGYALETAADNEVINVRLSL